MAKEFRYVLGIVFHSKTDPVPNSKRSYKEILEGDCFPNTRYNLLFKVNNGNAFLCQKSLTYDEFVKFRHAIKTKFEYCMYYDPFAFCDFIGFAKVKAAGRNELKRPRYYLYQDIRFRGYYPANKLLGIDVEANSDSHSLVYITDIDTIEVNFTYSIVWNQGEPDYSEGYQKWKEGSRDKDWELTKHSNLLFWNAVYAFLLFIWLGPSVIGSVTRKQTISLVLPLSIANASNALNQAHGPPDRSFHGAFVGTGIQLLVEKATTACFYASTFIIIQAFELFAGSFAEFVHHGCNFLAYSLSLCFPDIHVQTENICFPDLCHIPVQ